MKMSKTETKALIQKAFEAQMSKVSSIDGNTDEKALQLIRKYHSGIVDALESVLALLDGNPVYVELMTKS